MQLEKIVTDWYTFYCKPKALEKMKNCVIYISGYNIECLKREINKIINDKSVEKFLKEAEIKEYSRLINFIRLNNAKLTEKVLQTDELEYISENNSYIVVVNDTKDIRDMNKDVKDAHINKEESDTIYIALAEEAQILTIKDSVNDFILEHDIPVFCLNIKNVE